jgi:Complex I intermediate-associated protein 30 (CIA30)
LCATGIFRESVFVITFDCLAGAWISSTFILKGLCLGWDLSSRARLLSCHSPAISNVPSRNLRKTHQQVCGQLFQAIEYPPSQFQVMYMKGAEVPSQSFKSLYTFRSKEDLAGFVIGSDRDMGGASSAKLELNDEGRGIFRGSLRATVMTSKGGLGGYAAFRSRVSCFPFLTRTQTILQSRAIVF